MVAAQLVKRGETLYLASPAAVEEYLADQLVLYALRREGFTFIPHAICRPISRWWTFFDAFGLNREQMANADEH